MGIFLAILALSFLIVVHELGHFLVAKAFKVKVNEFSLFMGPKLFSIKKGETTYSIRLVPLGGYVKMEGEEESSDDDRAYNKKPIGVRAAIIAAGPIMNIITAIVFAFILMSTSGFFTTTVKDILPGSVAEQQGLQPGDKITKYNNKTLLNVNELELFAYPLKVNDSIELEYERAGVKKTVKMTPDRQSYILGFTPLEPGLTDADSNVVKEVSPDSPAQKSGLKAGDRIVKLNDFKVRNRQDVKNALGKIKSNKTNITVDRNGKIETLSPVVAQSTKNPEYYAIGIGFDSIEGNLGATVKESVKYTAFLARSIYYSLGWLVSGVVPSTELMGPVGITTTISNEVQKSQSVMEAVLRLLSITTMISVNLGIVNLIPFPALDGSKLVLLLVEGIRKKPLNPEKEALITMIGMVLLIMLMIYATFNDFLR